MTQSVDTAKLHLPSEVILHHSPIQLRQDVVDCGPDLGCALFSN